MTRILRPHMDLKCGPRTLFSLLRFDRGKGGSSPLHQHLRAAGHHAPNSRIVSANEGTGTDAIDYRWRGKFGGMVINPARARSSAAYEDRTYYFCSVNCRDCFERDPERDLGRTAIDFGNTTMPD